MSKIGACGDNCNYCLRYLATNNDDVIAMDRIKELWIQLGWRDANVDVETLKCTGCTQENKCAYSTLRDCVIEKGLYNCGQCSGYPCELATDAFKRAEVSMSSDKLEACTQEERELLIKAFGLKKDNLDKINQKRFPVTNRD